MFVINIDYLQNAIDNEVKIIGPLRQSSIFIYFRCSLFVHSQSTLYMRASFKPNHKKGLTLFFISINNHLKTFFVNYYLFFPPNFYFDSL